MNKVDRDIANLPDTTVSVKEKFGFDSNMVVPAYSVADAHVRLQAVRAAGCVRTAAVRPEPSDPDARLS